MTKQFAQAVGAIVDQFKEAYESDLWVCFDTLERIADLLKAHAVEREDVDDWSVERV